MKLKFLGTGTSQGVPVIGCKDEVCTSKDLKDRRFRASALITSNSGKKILIDCGPDFRMQMLDNDESQVDAVLITHEHTDHVIGLDDLRPIIFRNKKDMPIYTLPRVVHEIKNKFPYAFTEIKYPGVPTFEINEIGAEKFTVENVEITPIPVMHYKLPILGFKFKNLCYITDASFFPEETFPLLKDLDVLIINCLRKAPEHISHFVLPEILELNKILKPKKIYLTHISHEFGLHEIVQKELPENIFLAYDGLEIEF
ncbi:MBL fold metallo-hydrolase [Halpernia frigidisoli]|uniref:Phosphoribosyl 1,2-cyclic phosphate phosphodiesterase n=1 Tax=Halpernia frigidisoli TaxID=1125876 RepID=A0A1I3IN46_9FLAO|nr:MBL fold metallo-hydrolase [Halpernia frigidisoli]SFI49398.1 phosphoribosyl 1,2-cyclic phosphate phosphodiesterase [Halpernia frigidisoli]